MSEPAQNIFREKVLKRYLEERQESALPPLIGKTVILYLWVAVSFLLIGGVIIYLHLADALSHG